MDWQDLVDRWPELTDWIRAEHPDLNADELQRTDEGRRKLMQLAETHYGLATVKSEEEAHPVVTEGGKNG